MVRVRVRVRVRVHGHHLVDGELQLGRALGQRREELVHLGELLDVLGRVLGQSKGQGQGQGHG